MVLCLVERKNSYKCLLSTLFRIVIPPPTPPKTNKSGIFRRTHPPPKGNICHFVALSSNLCVFLWIVLILRIVIACGSSALAFI